jgi:hypothetical protein
MDKTLTKRLFEELDINMHVEEEALKIRGFQIEDVLSKAKVVNREKISDLILDSQASLVF